MNLIAWMDGKKLLLTALLTFALSLNELFHWFPDSVRDSIILIAGAFGIVGLNGKFEKQKQATVAQTQAVEAQTAVLAAQTVAVVNAVESAAPPPTSVPANVARGGER